MQLSWHYWITFSREKFYLFLFSFLALQGKLNRINTRKGEEEWKRRPKWILYLWSLASFDSINCHKTYKFNMQKEKGRRKGCEFRICNRIQVVRLLLNFIHQYDAVMQTSCSYKMSCKRSFNILIIASCYKINILKICTNAHTFDLINLLICKFPNTSCENHIWFILYVT